MTNLPKGDLYATARIAGIQAAKKCSDLIPLCHPLPLSKITVDIELQGNSLLITALCKTTGKTGVEMEALTAASVAALTVYDMCKGLDKGMIIRETKLLEKSGGKSGDWSCLMVNCSCFLVVWVILLQDVAASIEASTPARFVSQLAADFPA